MFCISTLLALEKQLRLHLTHWDNRWLKHPPSLPLMVELESFLSVRKKLSSPMDLFFHKGQHSFCFASVLPSKKKEVCKCTSIFANPWLPKRFVCPFYNELKKKKKRKTNERYFSLKVFALQFCNIYIIAIFKKTPPISVFCKYFFRCQT